MISLRLLQLGDSALPVGGYTHSWGLETAIQRGAVDDAASLESWTRSWLRRSVGPMEGVVIACVCRAVGDARWDEVLRADHLVTASLNPASLRSASHEMGEQLLALAATWEWSRPIVEALTAASKLPRPDPHPEPGRVGCAHQFLVSPDKDGGHSPPYNSDVHRPNDPRLPDARDGTKNNYCVAFGVLAAAAGATAEEALCVYLNQAALGMIAAGVRGIPVGHTHAQQILAYLHDDIQELTRAHSRQELNAAGSGCPYYEVLCHEQPRLYSRLFRS